MNFAPFAAAAGHRWVETAGNPGPHAPFLFCQGKTARIFRVHFHGLSITRWAMNARGNESSRDMISFEFLFFIFQKTILHFRRHLQEHRGCSSSIFILQT
jgi:hypothetical protein